VPLPQQSSLHGERLVPAECGKEHARTGGIVVVYDDAVTAVDREVHPVEQAHTRAAGTGKSRVPLGRGIHQRE
jgi:hypothetical protein